MYWFTPSWSPLPCDGREKYGDAAGEQTFFRGLISSPGLLRYDFAEFLEPHQRMRIVDQL